MRGVLAFALLQAFVILRVESFAATPTPSSSTTSTPRGLSYEAIAGLARKRYRNGRDAPIEENEYVPMKGRVVVITGAAGGIGGQLSRTVHRLGGTVVALDCNTIGLEKLQKTLVEEYSDETTATTTTDDCDDDARNHACERIVTIPTNQQDLSSVASAAETIQSRFGRIDILVNNAGMSYRKDPMVSAHGNDFAFTVNYLSHFLLTEKLLPNLSKDGRIVHITSTFHWKVDGSELLPDDETGMPIAYQSDPEKQSPEHVGRSYANTKLAQLWHSRSIVANYAPTGGGRRVSSVCACPLWAATGIAGDEAKEFLDRYAFSVSDCGPGVTSAINAMLREDEELGDALNDGKSFVANSRILDFLTVRHLLASDFVTNTLGWRDSLADFLAVVLLLGQKYKHEDFILQQTSPESFNDKQRRDRFYRWSKEEVKQWL
mmetsp:Transcript_2291/g.5529  ORF Transcript_2291/g.5529 Transcript_2291/m.5529 type:complete len:433 (-) Transcript_2291:235-1533(-)